MMKKRCNIVKKIAAIIAAGMVVCGLATTAFAGTWQNDGFGWWYLNDDGSYPVNQWMNDGYDWYHFDESGYMQTGWTLADGSWYYMQPSGSMYTGWLQSGSDWYYLMPAGEMATGLTSVDGVTQIFDDNGIWLGQSQDIPQDDNYYSGEIVYVTATGEKFHRITCPTIKNSRNIYEIHRDDAIWQGYGACKVCNP